MATDYTGTGFGAELPSPTMLLRAFREPVTDLLTDPADPIRRDREVLEAAHDLVQCHERRHHAHEAAHAAGATPRRVAECSRLAEEIDERRTELVARIDDWVAINIPHRAGASLHTETLGAVIDRMAAKWVAAQQALGAPAPGVPRAKSTDGRRRHIGLRISDSPRRADSEAHLQWYRLAELADGYKDLIADVAQHRRRLPVW
ncbi:MAG: hypothetical protein JWN03_1514 [Nocardia sp.]|uniref:DUF4254 domain-containing protein n=1 Tax=Nocardia sp. TaxID=1821 RepID=UPI002610328C|nr:DUF4254 domain-containing protein [Nocardia sp.]MCU1641239.1 hypothetical protein [Nocardia sp.]